MKNNKRLLSLIMALAISVSAFTAFKPGIKAAADESGITPPYSVDKLLYESDFSENSLKGKYSSSNNTYSYLGDLNSVDDVTLRSDFSKIYGTLSSVEYFWYAQFRSGIASLPLGYYAFYNNMKTRTDTGLTWNDNCYVIPKSGVTYKVEYKYKNSGKTTSDLTIKLAVANIGYDTTTNERNLNDIKVENTIAAYSAGTELTDNEWQPNTAYITVPSNTEIDESNDRLYITFEGGGSGDNKPFYYIDDVKVTALAPDYLFKYNTNGGTAAGGSEYTPYSFYSVESGNFTPEAPVNGDFGFGGWYTDEQLENAYNPENYNTAQQALQTVELYAKWNDILLNSNDYEKATTRYIESTTPNYTSNLYEWSGHLSVINSTDVDSNDTHGKVIDYAQGYTGIASIVLGYDYVYQFIDEHNECYRVTPEAGKTYKVQYDYKITGTVYSKLKIGLAAGYYKYSKNPWGYDTAETKTVVETTDIAADTGNVYGDGVWRTSTAYITVPSDAEMPEKPRLYLTFSGGGTGDGKAHVYVDNVSVYETNKSETITIEGDVNGDKCIDDNDLTALRKMILGIKQENGYIYDVNRDKSVNILDLVSVKELIK